MATSVLPSPVRISAILPWCRQIPPITCTWKCFMPSTRQAASRSAAKASGRISSNVSPAGQTPLEEFRLPLELIVVHGGIFAVELFHLIRDLV